MSDGADQVIKKQKVNDDESAVCSQIFDTCSQSLLYETQSSDSNKSTQIINDRGDIMIENNNDQDTCNSRQITQKRGGKTPAERNRLYRERHREEINQRRRENRRRKKNSQQLHNRSIIYNIKTFEKTINASSNNERSSSYTHRQKRYYETHKREINKRKRERRLQQNISQAIPFTGAERNGNYQERNKQKIEEECRRNSRLMQQNVQRGFHKVMIKSDPDAHEIDENNLSINDTDTNSSIFEAKLDFNDVIPILSDISSHLQTMANVQEDPLESFGKYVAAVLRNMPERSSMELQVQIVNLLQTK